MTWGLRRDMIVHSTDPLNAEPTRAALAGSELTPDGTFYVRNHGPVPQVSPAEWRLRVGGPGTRPLQLSLAGLQRDFTAHEVVAALQCAGNRRAGLPKVRDIPGESPWGPGAMANARWTGARLADVLAAAGLAGGPRESTGHVAFGAPDVSGLASPPQPFGGSIPVGKAMRGEVLLAWAMNGQPLPAVHGGPVRVVVPGYIGARSVKWVDRVTVQAEPSANYFQATAYRATLDLPPGPAEVIARAWDAAAGVQPEDEAQLWNPNGYMNTAWALVHLMAVG
jgi:sulfite oxidase